MPEDGTDRAFHGGARLLGGMGSTSSKLWRPCGTSTTSTAAPLLPAAVRNSSTVAVK
jgi:hypothetical protein